MDTSHPTLHLHTRTCDGAPVLQVRGEVDLCTAPRLLDATAALLAQGDGHLRVDLGRVRLLDSTGVRALFQLAAFQQQRRRQLLILRASHAVRRVLGALGMDFLLWARSGPSQQPELPRRRRETDRLRRSARLHTSVLRGPVPA